METIGEVRSVCIHLTRALPLPPPRFSWYIKEGGREQRKSFSTLTGIYLTTSIKVSEKNIRGMFK